MSSTEDKNIKKQLDDNDLNNVSGGASSNSSVAKYHEGQIVYNETIQYQIVKVISLPNKGYMYQCKRTCNTGCLVINEDQLSLKPMHHFC